MPNKENEYVITGDSGNGLTHGAIGALVISDLINHKRNAWAKLYDPARKTVGSLPRFAREKAKIAARYSAWLKTIKGPQNLRAGRGAVIKKGAQAEAIFREKGKIHSYSPLCTHLRCTVRWNDIEKSFDCPCHGSRFSSRGKIINGPGNKDLKKKTERRPRSEGVDLMIRKVKGGYRVVAESGRNMGTYKTLAEAKKRLRQIEFFKHQAKRGK
jgi:nitrite reductase/ring-hydroxylating ferredoxin subunit